MDSFWKQYQSTSESEWPSSFQETLWSPFSIEDTCRIAGDKIAIKSSRASCWVFSFSGATPCVEGRKSWSVMISHKSSTRPLPLWNPHVCLKAVCRMLLRQCSDWSVPCTQCGLKQKPVQGMLAAWILSYVHIWVFPKKVVPPNHEFE